MAFGAAARALEAEVVRFAEDLGQLLSLLVFFALGVVAFDVLDAVTWKMCLYTVLTLTAIRMLPVAVALAGTGLRPWTVVYLGWFGPRGLASVVLALILLIEYPGIPGVGALELTVLLTVLVSVFAHGASAAPLTARFARLPYLGDEAAPERAAAVDVRVRR
jgi:NhaP-type Na+/H+ or K+/H+ antiporter